MNYVICKKGHSFKTCFYKKRSNRGFFVEINLKKKKWSFSCSYNTNRENIENHLETLSKCLDLCSSSYDNLIIVGDFNVYVDEICMSGFCDILGYKNLIRDTTCYKNPENPSSTGLVLTNNLRSFRNSSVIEAGLSDFHRTVVTAMKTSFQRLKSRVVNYRDYRSLKNKVF